MLIHIPTGRKFSNRKEAKMFYGTSKYNRLCRDKQFLLKEKEDK